MTRTHVILWVAGAGALIYLLSRTQTAQSALTSGEDLVTATVAGWKAVEQGPIWVPILNAAEVQYNIPADLLARIAFQESNFRPSVINGTEPNPKSGALGMMQMLPKYFTSVQVPIPFTPDDTITQIDQAAQLLSSDYATFGDWGLAVAAYNDGATNIKNVLAGTHPLPAETRIYVSKVLADVPLPTTLQV